MGFSNLIYLWTAILPLTVLIYYFFRKKYKDTPISSTLFWQEVMLETRVSPYLKHLQRNALFYLQMLALILFVLALLNPYVKTKELSGEQIIWIVDTSATMLAGEKVSTFDQHKEEMKSMLDDLNGKPVTIITTGEEPKTLVQQETNKNEIKKAVENLTVTYEKQQLSKAVDVANAFIGKAPTSIYLFTDSVEKNELPIESDQVKWIVKGAKGKLDNVSITRFAATSNGKEIVALIQISNDTEKDKTIKLSIRNEDENVIQEQIEIKAKEQVSKAFEKIPMTTKLTAEIEVDDHYTIDNKEVVLINNQNMDITIDNQMHKLVQKGFQAVNTNVKLVPSEQLESLNGKTLIVTNQVDLLSKTSSPIVLIGRDDEEAEEINSLVNVSKDDLFTFSPLEEVYVSSIYPAFEQFETIATIGEKPFIQRSSRGDIVILADIQSTDWPLHPTFPLFLWSLQNELMEGKGLLGVFTPNESRAVSIVDGDWSIYSSEDEYISTVKKANEFRAPEKPGYYVIRNDENEEKHFIVQLEQEEKVIKEGKDFELGNLANSEQEIDTNKSLIPWIAFVILLVMLIEWEVQRRRGFTN